MKKRDRLARVRRLFERLEQKHLLASDLYISEFVAANDSVLVDEDGDSSDFLEIYNGGTEDVSLEGWYLTDDADELDKWAFPDEVLSAGEFLLVFASDKDRSIAGEQLHTNFRLSADGEYLALVDGNDVASDFSPEFPPQLRDISYGVTQEVGVDSFVQHDQASTIWVSNSAPAGDWTAIDFDSSSWLASSAAVGYQNRVPGFTVEDAKAEGRIVNLTEATAVLDGTGQATKATKITPTVNFLDGEGGGGAGNFGSDASFPGDTPNDDNDFAIRASGVVTIPTSGLWTFGTNSDDGVRVRVGDELVIDDDTLHAPQDHFGTIDLDAGEYPIELVFFERGGGAEVELFAAPGEFQSFVGIFELVGDIAGGGLEVSTSNAGGATSYGSLIQTDIEEQMFEQASSVFLRTPFQVADANDHDSLTLRVQYDDGFIAYLNGEEVARRNAEAPIDDRSVADAVLVESIDLTQHLDLLQEGDNVLAIQGLSISDDSDEFLLAVELSEFDVAVGDASYFREATPGDFNPASGASEFLVDDVTIDEPAGFYETAIDVKITADEGTSIRYTTDGTEPTEENGEEYSGPIRIDETTTLRARSFKDDAEPSFVETRTYLFLADIVNQSPNGSAPDGFPTSRNINGQVLDYGMDPAIVDSSTWGPQMVAALTQIPTMSVVMDIDDFLGRRGIYNHARSHGRAWERPASLELIHPDGTEGFQVNMGIRIRGGFSRSGNNPKHAFRFFFRDEYGDDKLDYPLFGDEGTDRFDKIDLRTTQNYSWSFQGSSENNFMRDIFSRDVQGMMGQPYTRGDYYHLYINSHYWGVFQTDERPEARYAASYFGGDSDDYDVVKSAGSSGGYANEATDGNLDAYRRLADFFYQSSGLSDNNMDDYYRAQGMNPDGTPNPDFERLLDVDNLISYMIITYFTSDADGPGSRFTRPRVNNYFGIYNRENPDGFKFFEHDSEHSLDTGDAAGANFNMVSPLTGSAGRQFRYFNPHWMHEQLANSNSHYRLRFADAVYKHLFNDGVLAPENAVKILNQRASEIDLAIIAESARWGDSKRNSPFTKNHWENAVQASRNWIQNRTDVVMGQLIRQDWYPAEGPPGFLVNGEPQHGGQTPGRVELVSASATSFDRVVRQRARWKFLDDGSNQGTGWREFDFDDSGWQEGRGQFGYGDGDEWTEISFGDDSNRKHVTTYFRHEFEIEDVENIDEGKLRLLRDDGAIVYINGIEVTRSNMPGGNVNYRTHASSVVGGASESTFIDYSFDRNALRQGRNVIAVELHQANNSSSDVSFDLELHVGVRAQSDAEVYYTLDGSDPRLPDGSINPAANRYLDTGILIADAVPITTRALQAGEWSPINSALFEPAGQTSGDLDGDGDIDTADIDALSAAIREGNQDAQFDLDNNGQVTADDHVYLIEGIMGGILGDIDLDRSVTFDDFLLLSSQFGKSDANYADGDLNGDALVNFDDFLLLSGNFGKSAPQAAVARASANVVDLAFAAGESDDEEESRQSEDWELA